MMRIQKYLKKIFLLVSSSFFLFSSSSCYNIKLKEEYNKNLVEIPIVLHFDPSTEGINKKIINLFIISNDKISNDNSLRINIIDILYDVEINFISLDEDISKKNQLKKITEDYNYFSEIKPIHMYFINSLATDVEISGYLVEKTNFCESTILISYKSFNIETIAHELGHEAGLGHVDNQNNVMYYTKRKENSVFNDWQLRVIKNYFENRKILCKI